MTPSVPWSSPTSCSARGNGSSFTTPTAAWSSSRTKSFADLLSSSLETAELVPDGFRDVGRGPGSSEAKFIDWLTIADNAQSVVDDVTRIRNHPLVPSRIAIYGFIYDVTTGRLEEVQEATKAGLPS